MDEKVSLELVTPFLSHEHIIELCSGRRALDAWRDAKLNLYRRRLTEAYRNQEEIARTNHAREMRYVDGAGYHRLSIDPVLHAAAKLRYGEKIWQDPDFRRRVERDHPEMRVPRPARKFIPVNGFKETTQ